MQILFEFYGPIVLFLVIFGITLAFALNLEKVCVKAKQLHPGIDFLDSEE